MTIAPPQPSPHGATLPLPFGRAVLPALRPQPPVPPPGARLLPVIPARHLHLVPPSPGSRRRLPRLRLPRVDGDTAITVAMTLTVSAVILFAAVVSYSHVYALALAHHEDSIQAHLLPLSLDGMIAEASLVMLWAARQKGIRTPPLARFMLWTGVAATLGANALVALPPQWISPVANAVIGAVMSAWPAGAFIASAELVTRLVRDIRAVRDSDTDGAGDKPADNIAAASTDTRTDRPRDRTRRAGRAARRRRWWQRTPPAQDIPNRTAADRRPPAGPVQAPVIPADAPVKRDKLTAVLLDRWGDDDNAIAQRCGVHPRTVRRRRERLLEVANAKAA